MRITRTGGLVMQADTSLYQSEKVEALFEADGAILAGHAVMLDASGNTDGRLVITATTGVDHAVVGIYEGEGGTGAAAGTGFTGKAAADGDIIAVTIYGVAVADVEGGTVDVAAGNALKISADNAGELQAAGNIDAGVQGCIIALEAETGTSGVAHEVFVRCM